MNAKLTYCGFTDLRSVGSLWGCFWSAIVEVSWLTSHWFVSGVGATKDAALWDLTQKLNGIEIQ